MFALRHRFKSAVIVRAADPREKVMPREVPCEITVCALCGDAACWEGMFLCDQSRTAGTTTKQGTGYRCQFCGVTSPVKRWRAGGEECPKCKRIYDAVLAQESP